MKRRMTIRRKDSAPALPKKLSPPEVRAKIVEEILNTERDYVQHLEDIVEVRGRGREGGREGGRDVGVRKCWSVRAGGTTMCKRQRIAARLDAGGRTKASCC